MHRYFYRTLVGVTLLTACSSEKAPSVDAGQDQAVLAGEVVNLSGRAKGAGEKSREHAEELSGAQHPTWS
mgnify:CR=1 FL=1